MGDRRGSAEHEFEVARVLAEGHVRESDDVRLVRFHCGDRRYDVSFLDRHAEPGISRS